MDQSRRPLSELPELHIGSLLIRAIDSPENTPQMWLYNPLITPVAGTIETIDTLIKRGWQQVPSFYQFALCTQLHDAILLQDITDEKRFHVWTPETSANYVKQYPVALAGILDIDEESNVQTISGRKTIFMLTPLPLPNAAMNGFILNEDQNSTLDGYPMNALPDEAKRRALMVRQLLVKLAGARWIARRSSHDFALDLVECQREINKLITRQHITYGETRHQITLQIAELRQALLEVRQVLKMQMEPTYAENMKEVRQLMQQLARDYFELHQTKTPGEVVTLFPDLPPKTKQQRPTMQRTFDAHGYAPIVAALPMQAIINSVNNITGRNSDAWIFNEDERNAPYYPYVRDAGSTTIEYRRDEERIQRDTRSAQALWEEVKSFDEQAGDIILDIFSHLSRNMQDGAAWFFASEHLDNRQLTPITKLENGKRRRAGHRKEDMLPISRTLSRLENLWLVINQQIDDPTDTSPKKKGKTTRKKTRYTHTGRFLMVSQVWYQDELTGDEGDSLVPSETRFPIGWYIRPGDWLRTFLEAPNYQVTQLCKTILTYDPYREKWEKAIAKYLMFHGHMQCRGKGGVLSRRIRLIIDEVSLPLNTSNPIKNRKNFEKAMNRLAEDAVIDGWCYESETSLPYKNWLNDWLDWSVKIYIASPQNKIQKGKQD